ncbi:hypothetical protein [Idiomarina piscisalsi]|uniref:hypothetical protein n=1 Tax=Idiomarina piscisalsi TaxID=1096243 RepID=UPI0018E528C4|nr:hypothetical protein [Idiomarina piscisalsi]
MLEDTESGEFTLVQVAKSYTRILEKGSIWKNGEYHSERADLIEAIFEFSIDPKDDGNFVSAWERVDESDNSEEGQNKRYILPPRKYQIPSSFKNTKFFTVRTECGVELLANSLTIFDNTYGASQFLQQTVLNNYTNAALEKLEFKKFDTADFSNPPQHDEYRLGLSKEVYDDDRYFIWALKSQRYTQRTVNYISAQLDSNRARATYLSVRPWFSGSHKWLVSGIWLEKGKRFLVLKIHRYKLPQCPDFFIIRENSNIADENGNSSENERKKCAKTASKKLIGTSKSRPSSSSMGEDLRLGDIEHWGETGLQKAVPKENKTKNTQVKIVPTPQGKVSPSNQGGSDPNIGKLNLTNGDDEPKKESPNTLNLLWSALNKLITEKSQQVSKPASLSGIDSGVFTSGQLALIEPEHDNDWLFKKEHRRLNRQTYKGLPKRRFGVFHITFKGINFFFVCIERFNSDKFRTAIFRFSSRSDFLNALPQILVGIVDAKGVWKRAAGIAGSNVSLITHRGNEVAIASQISGKLEAAIES